MYKKLNDFLNKYLNVRKLKNKFNILTLVLPISIVFFIYWLFSFLHSSKIYTYSLPAHFLHFQFPGGTGIGILLMLFVFWVVSFIISILFLFCRIFFIKNLKIIQVSYVVLFIIITLINIYEFLLFYSIEPNYLHNLWSFFDALLLCILLTFSNYLIPLIIYFFDFLFVFYKINK